MKKPRFEKGGEPGPGRPKGSGRNQRCLTWANKYGLKFLEDVAEGKIKDIDGFGRECKPNLRVRTDCAKYLADQGLGKAPARHEISGPEGGPVPVSLAELLAQPDGNSPAA